jgi:hypothetical protein
MAKKVGSRLDSPCAGRQDSSATRARSIQSEARAVNVAADRRREAAPELIRQASFAPTVDSDRVGANHQITAIFSNGTFCARHENA